MTLKIVCSHYAAKNLSHFTNFPANIFLFGVRRNNLNSLDIENSMLSLRSQKPFSLYKFSSQHFSVWCQKKHLQCIISSRSRTAFFKQFESKCLYISVRKFMFLRCSKILSALEKQNDFPKDGSLFEPRKILIQIFGNSTIFSISILPSIALKRWNFPHNFDLWLNFSYKVPFSQYK